MAKIVLINKNEIEKELKLAGWHASVSYDSKNFNETVVAKHCIEAGHGTTTRGMRFIFEISEVSRAFSHEFVRHELGVYKVQRSQRYVNEDGFKYVTPDALVDIRVLAKIPLVTFDPVSNNYTYEDTIETWLSYHDFQDIVKQMYTGFVKAGAKPEDARYALTNATFTKIHVIMNWEGLDQFCYRRCCTRAQWEIRDVAFQAKAEVTSVSEFLGNKLGAHCLKHGYCPELPKGCGIAPNKKDFLDTFLIGKEVIQNQKYKLAD